MLSPVWIMVTLLHFQVGPSLNVITKWTLWELEGPHRLLLSFEGEHFGWARTNWLALVSPKGKPLHYSNSVDLMSYFVCQLCDILMERKCHICDIIVRNKLRLAQSNTLVLGFLMVSWIYPGELHVARCTGNPVLGRSPIKINSHKINKLVGEDNQWYLYVVTNLSRDLSQCLMGFATVLPVIIPGVDSPFIPTCGDHNCFVENIIIECRSSPISSW